jgi:hypothetical protein
MKKLLVHCILMLIGVSIAAWLQLFDYSLTGESWEHLIGQPLRAWVGAILGLPAFELFFNWWAFLLASLLYASLTWVWVKYRGNMSQLAAILLGLAVGGGLSLLIQSLRTTHLHPVDVTVLGTLVHLNWWLYPSPELVAKLFLVYATTGLLYGWLYYQWLIAKPPLVKSGQSHS